MLYYPLLALMFPFMQADTARVDTSRTDNTIRVDTLKELEVRGDSVLRVNEAIRQTIGRELKSRQGTPTLSDTPRRGYPPAGHR